MKKTYMNEKEEINDAIFLLNDHLDIKQTSLELNNTAIQNYENLRDKLIEVIHYLLNNDVQKLLTAVYRIDVSEEKFKSAMENENINLISESIADLIFERELQKVKYRKKFPG
ncbi:MAG: hypothetical protein JW917_04370 [Ignavibacteria bacterium]|nr:hypothetical protein [Ignavibacteria bacterium]